MSSDAYFKEKTAYIDNDGTITVSLTIQDNLTVRNSKIHVMTSKGDEINTSIYDIYLKNGSGSVTFSNNNVTVGSTLYLDFEGTIGTGYNDGVHAPDEPVEPNVTVTVEDLSEIKITNFIEAIKARIARDISTHNTDNTTHSDIRTTITSQDTRITALEEEIEDLEEDLVS